METNPLLAHRVIPQRERVEKTVVAVVVYLAVMGGLYRYHGELPERFSGEFFVAIAVSIVLLAFVIQSAFKHEKATDRDRARMIRMRIDDDRSGRHWSSRIGMNARVLLGRIVMLFGIALVIAGLFVLGKQVYVWVMTDTWVPASTLQFVRPWVDWLFTKDIWVPGQRALIRALDWLHVSVPLGLIGVLLAGRGASFIERAKEKALAARR